MDEIKLNLGCGCRILKDYENVDINGKWGTQLDLTDPLPYENNSVSKIFSSHFIEHIEYTDVESVLADWHRVLKKGGELELWTPDFDRVVKGGAWKWVNWRLYARNTGHKGCQHRCIFNYEWLSDMLKGIGFEQIERIPLKEFPFKAHQDCNMGVRCKK